LTDNSQKPPSLGCTTCFKNFGALIEECNTMGTRAMDVLDIIASIMKIDELHKPFVG